MKHTLLIITALLFFSSTAIPQTKMNINNLVEYGDKKYKPNDDEPYTGRVFDLWEHGNKKLEGSYRKGIKDRKWTWYNEDEKTDSSGTFKDGKKDGLWIEWYSNGQKIWEKTYKDGKLIKETGWDKYGNRK